MSREVCGFKIAMKFSKEIIIRLLEPEMTVQEIIKWSHKVLQDIKTHRPFEDSAIELKRNANISAANHLARQIAAHANSARGENILWLIGVDEDKGIVGVGEKIEFATLWDSIKKYFEGVPPSPHEVWTEIDGKDILAICFNTSHAPFVVRNAKDQQILEVPWREGTAARSARQSELIRMLSISAKQPHISFFKDSDLIVNNKTDDFTKLVWKLKLILHIMPVDNNIITIPEYYCSATVSSDDHKIDLDFKNIDFDTDTEKTAQTYTGNEMCITGPCKLWISGHVRTEAFDYKECKDLKLTFNLRPINFEEKLTLNANLELRFINEEQFTATWRYKEVE